MQRPELGSHVNQTPGSALTRLARGLAGRSRRLRFAALCLFAAQFVLLELAVRGVRPYAADPVHVLAAVQSASLWTLLALLAERRAIRAAVAALAASLLVLQAVFFARYGTFVDRQVVLSTIRFWPDIKPTLVPLLPRLALIATLAWAGEYAWLGFACGSGRS
jgi:hypothetical protein